MSLPKGMMPKGEVRKSAPKSALHVLPHTRPIFRRGEVGSDKGKGNIIFRYDGTLLMLVS